MRYTDPTGMWLDNGDGTFTAQEDDTLWEKYGADWQEKSGFKGDPKTLKPGDIVGQKKSTPMMKYSNRDIERKDKMLSQKSYAEEYVEEPNYIVQGLLGAGEFAMGVVVDVATTAGVILAESAQSKLHLPLPKDVGEMAMFGYTVGGLLMADGISSVAFSIKGEKRDVMFYSLFKDLYLSSSYQDFGKAIQIYEEKRK